MILYNLFPLLAGPMSNWQPHFARAAAMGFDWAYLNPIQQLGASRSLYSIADYFAVNPVFLDGKASTADEQVRKMIQSANGLGLKVMIDLVINHCAIDAPITREHPEWFVRGNNGQIACASCEHNGERVVWQDLAQFNHRGMNNHASFYAYCARIIDHLMGLGFEGFRCDAAYQVPSDLWRRLINHAKQNNPGVQFVAETLGCNADQTRETARAGFDYVFNSSKWWNLQDWWLIEQYNLVRETARSISFPESHDTPRLSDELQGNEAGLKQRYLFSALFSAGVMAPMGFEYGLRKPLHVVHTHPGDWQPNGVDLTQFISRVNAIKRSHAVFQEESPTSIIPCSNPNILLLWKASNRHRDEALVILNKDLHHHQEFATDHFRHFVQTGTALRDVSPEFPMDYIHEPFHYALRPGQGIVLAAQRG